MVNRIKDLWEEKVVARDRFNRARWQRTCAAGRGVGGVLAELALTISLVVFIFGGWIGNVYKLTKADFASPYKTEIIRGFGVPFVPLGIVVGWMDIGEEND